MVFGQTGINQQNLSSLRSCYHISKYSMVVLWAVFCTGKDSTLVFAHLPRLAWRREYWIIGDGPERKSCQLWLVNFGIATARFWEVCPVKSFTQIGECHVLFIPVCMTSHQQCVWLCSRSASYVEPRGPAYTGDRRNWHWSLPIPPIRRYAT